MAPESQSECSPKTAISTRSTSTTRYEQEPFETFQVKVRSLMEGLFSPHGVNEVHRLRGGSSNRVTGIVLSNGARYIVRCPRQEDDWLEVPDQVAVLRYVQEHLPVPIPTIVHFDPTSNNPLESPYAVQNWVEGRNLRELMLEEDVSSRMNIAKAVVELMKKMYVTKPFQSAGVIRAKDPLAKTTHLTLPDCPGANLIPPAPITDSLTFLTTCWDMMTEESLRNNDPDFNPRYFRRFAAAAQSLHARRPFSNRFCIMHPDFEPRNMIVRKTEDGEFVVEAMLDYDGAMVAPIEAVWTAPHWLWTWDLEDSDNEDDENLPFLEPVLPETKEVKEYVERELDACFPGFMEIWRNGAVARELLYFATQDFQDWERAERLLGPASDAHLRKREATFWGLEWRPRSKPKVAPSVPGAHGTISSTVPDNVAPLVMT